MQRFQVAILPIAVLVSLALSSTTQAYENSNLSIKIDGIKSQKGQVCFSLFSSSRGFPANGKKALRSRCVKVTEKSVQANFAELKPGSYAVAVIHDANADGTLNSNAIGIPKEGFGFSQNPRILTGPPKFGESVFFVAGPNTNIDIKLQYLL
ncbi:MAG: DUF2141 domain-containing protein [Calothrix sp. MO_167.B12]|nr:DUF2141 domain-containing protein [Calothrix sp. MO_167.B12]